MKRLNISVLLIAILFFSACSKSLKNTKVTAENKQQIMSRISLGNEVTDEERQLLVEYSVRYNLASIMKGNGPDRRAAEVGCRASAKWKRAAATRPLDPLCYEYGFIVW
jgi:hypothetical protein